MLITIFVKRLKLIWINAQNLGLSPIKITQCFFLWLEQQHLTKKCVNNDIQANWGKSLFIYSIGNEKEIKPKKLCMVFLFVRKKSSFWLSAVPHLYITIFLAYGQESQSSWAWRGRTRTEEIEKMETRRGASASCFTPAPLSLGCPTQYVLLWYNVFVLAFVMYFSIEQTSFFQGEAWHNWLGSLFRPMPT